jgi:radical SAM protein with 4Fe4S-binding SPASM domain
MQKVGDHMKLEQFKKLLDTSPNIQTLNITGIGEALMNPFFLDMVEYAKKKGIYVWFSDNMTLMTEKTAQRLLDAGVDFIALSLDGATKETFEKIRVGARFEQVLENTRRLIRLRDTQGKKNPLVGINCVVTKENYLEIEQMVRLAHEMKIDRLMFMTILVSNSNGEFSLYSVSKADLDQVLDNAKKLAGELGVKVIAWPNSEVKMSKVTGCDYPWQNPYITYNGDVLPCCFIPQETNGRNREENIMGNIMKEDLKTIWNNENYVSFRQKIKSSNPPISCKKCPKFYGLC